MGLLDYPHKEYISTVHPTMRTGKFDSIEQRFPGIPKGLLHEVVEVPGHSTFDKRCVKHYPALPLPALPHAAPMRNQYLDTSTV